MRLKSLEIQGFKSFPDKTLFSFDSGVTVIIGPNGSGKSNIAEAVRWVLGELSSKSIRGNKMEDIIFGGTDNRRPMNYAQVSLTIEDFDGSDSHGNNVVITRRYYRNGESDYLINHKAGRLKDITELFLNTGIGHSGYSIVGQGKVAEIISQRSEERRNVFEEAAGISKYRYKKNESERRLHTADENIIRINDILSELGSRVESLRTEAERARVYLEIYENKKRADVSIFLYDVLNLRTQLKEIDDRHTIAAHELEIADDNLSALEKQTESIYLKSQDNKLKIEQSDRKIREYTAKINSLESDNKVLLNDIKHIENEIEQNNLDIKVKTNALETAKNRNETLVGNYAELEQKLSQLDSDYKTVSVKCDSINNELLSVISSINIQTTEVEKIKSANVDNQIKLSTLSEKYNTDVQKLSELKTELRELNEQSGLLNDMINKGDTLIVDYKEKLSQMDLKSAEINEKITNIQSEKNIITDKINSVHVEISTLTQRIDTLKRMDDLFEGYSRSVRFVMDNVADGTLSGDGIFGPVSKLITVKPRYIVAIETAMGSNLQNIVTADEESAKEAINLLKKSNAGRATFYPLTSIQPQSLNIDIDELKKYDGYIGIASELLTYDEKFRDIVEYMLGRTIVTDNIDNASLMAKAFNYRIRIVTIDGQLINAGGSYTGGSVRRDSGMLSRTAEINKLESEIVKHEITLKSHEKNQAEIDVQINKYNAELDKIRYEITINNNLYQAEYTQLQVLNSQINNNKQRINTIDNLIVDLQRNIDSHTKNQSDINTDLNNNTTKINNYDRDITDLSNKRDMLSSESEDNNKIKNDLFIKLTEQRKDVEIAHNTLKLNEESCKSIEEQISKTEQYTYSRHEQIIELRNNIERNKSDITALNEDCKKLEIEYNERREKSLIYDKDAEILKNKSRESTHKRENLFREFTKIESQRTQIVAEQDKLISRIWEDYELTYSSASTLGYPQIDAGSRGKMVALQNESRTKLREIGSVNVNSIEEFKEVNERYEFLTNQLNDLNKSKVEMQDIIYRLENEMRLKFAAAMKEINTHFKSIFRELFNGGNAELALTSPENILESGIEINVAPPGKIIKSLSLLSGGEQAFVAIALLFAILKVNPTPFCVFDEIEAALDDVNVIKFAEYCKRYSASTQFVIITHRRGTMESADVLYGVTMYEKGVSKILSLNVNDATEKIGEKV